MCMARVSLVCPGSPCLFTGTESQVQPDLTRYVHVGEAASAHQRILRRFSLADPPLALHDARPPLCPLFESQANLLICEPPGTAQNECPSLCTLSQTTEGTCSSGRSVDNHSSASTISSSGFTPHFMSAGPLDFSLETSTPSPLRPAPSPLRPSSVISLATCAAIVKSGRATMPNDSLAAATTFATGSPSSSPSSDAMNATFSDIVFGSSWEKPGFLKRRGPGALIAAARAMALPPSSCPHSAVRWLRERRAPRDTSMEPEVQLRPP